MTIMYYCDHCAEQFSYKKHKVKAMKQFEICQEVKPCNGFLLEYKINNSINFTTEEVQYGHKNIIYKPDIID